MSNHPLFDLAVDKEVKKVTGFPKLAVDLLGSALVESYAVERENAPDRHAVEKSYQAEHDGTLAKVPAADKPEHLAMALWNFNQGGTALELPEGGEIQLVDYDFEIATSSPEAKALGRVPLLALAAENRLTVIDLKFVAPSATRGSTGDTPLRGLVSGLGWAAVLEQRREQIAADLGIEISEEPPLVIVLGTSRYWQLCRKRGPQAGALWIRELERLGKEIETENGVSVRFLGISTPGDPGWTWEDKKPVLEGEPEVLLAWEADAGNPKPKSSKRADQIIEADLSRPVREYSFFDQYQPGDRIEHTTLGAGVVQRVAGPMKCEIMFGVTRKVMVCNRPDPSEVTA